MINPLNNLIEMNAKYNIDMLSNLSLSANASSTKYALCYKDFDPYKDYSMNTETTFIPTTKWWQDRVYGYLKQDEAKERDTTNNVSNKDFKYFKDLIQKSRCYLCNEGFTKENPPTLDRINNDIGHTKENVKLCCASCNTIKSNRTEEESRIYINIRSR